MLGKQTPHLTGGIEDADRSTDDIPGCTAGRHLGRCRHAALRFVARAVA